MYRQVALHITDKDYHRILWKDPGTGDLITLRMTRVTYGVTSSSYHSIRALQIATTATTVPATIEALKRGFYVDDNLGGADSTQDAIALRADLTQALATVQMPIRKWCTNSPDVAASIPPEDRGTATVVVAEGETGVRTLGVGWNMHKDVFAFIVPDAIKGKLSPDHGKPMTRRKLLSNIATVFDPLGWLGPTTIRMKILFQKTWVHTSSWDDQLPPEVVEQFIDWARDLLAVEFLEIPRHVFPNMDIDEPYTLALFCDSSETAMAACVYVCSTAVTRRNPRLLAAKTRLAPLKKQSVPRLELCAMCLGAKLVNAVQAALSHSPRQCDTILAFTDSTVALAWVASESARWKTFVANRVQQIHTALPGINWLHVPTDQNPADLGTRSASPPLNELKLWWNGPAFLREGEIPPQPQLSEQDANAETRRIVTVNADAPLSDVPTASQIPKTPTVDDGPLVLTHISDFQRLLRRINRTFAALYKLRGKTLPTYKNLALIAVLRQIQANAFPQ